MSKKDEWWLGEVRELKRIQENDTKGDQGHNKRFKL